MSNEVTLEAIKAFVNKVNESQQTMKTLFELEMKMYLFSTTSEYHNLREVLNKDAKALGISAIRQSKRGLMVTLTTQVFDSLNLEITNTKDSGIFIYCESDVGEMVLNTYRLQLARLQSDIKGM
ncbi:hypothetical protein [Lysinibacillus sp. F5]|uniref:hypothetical protein n=1 Tax=Lysinibacillus sp. F5 TaxID=1700846 RepID=UPI00073875DC|nr:hypothetical protein [Lysinibacillus sp. F5]KUF37409.1 hypothetical protein AK833_00535 [Lysinibacillus sp. F5]